MVVDARYCLGAVVTVPGQGGVVYSLQGLRKGRSVQGKDIAILLFPVQFRKEILDRIFGNVECD